MIDSMNKQLINNIIPANDIEKRFFQELLNTGGGHPSLSLDELDCTEVSDPKKLCKNPLVSVSVITYNQERFLRQTLDSIIEQKTEFEYEILIGEDCSTDETRKIALDYQKIYPSVIRVFYSIKNVGVTTNLRRNLIKARGKYYAICEGDDFWCNPEKLKSQVGFLEAHPDFGLIHGNANMVDVNSLLLKPAIQTRCYGDSELDQDDLAYDLLSGERSVITCTALVRKQVLNDAISSFPILFLTKLRLGDIQTWLGVSTQSKVHYFPQVFATYRYSTVSATSRGNPVKRLEFMADAFVVDMICVNSLLEANQNLKRILCRRLTGVITNLCYLTRTWPLLKTSLLMERLWDVAWIPMWMTKILYRVHIPYKVFSLLYRVGRRFRNVCDVANKT